jgi:hypothetical protein
MSSFPSLIESIGLVRWRLQVPHVGLADYRYLQRVGLRPYLRRVTPMRFAVCLLIGLAIGTSLALAVDHWHVWVDGTVGIGAGRHPFLIFEDDDVWMAMAALVAASVAATWLLFVTNYRLLVRRIYEASRRAMPYWSLEVGEDGLHMVWNEVALTIPWSDLKGLQSRSTATFLTFDAYFRAVGISHAGFATDAEREACLAFMRAKISTRQQTG